MAELLVQRITLAEVLEVSAAMVAPLHLTVQILLQVASVVVL
jgi:hypothetical protein